MSIFRTEAPEKAKREIAGAVHPFTEPRKPIGPPDGPGDVHHVPIPQPARTAGEKR